MREYEDSIFFNSSYNEVFEENESALKRMKKEYEEIKDLTEENYFDGLTMKKKEKIIGFNDFGGIIEEETKASLSIPLNEEDARIEKIINAPIYKGKKKAIKKIKYYINNVIMKNKQ